MGCVLSLLGVDAVLCTSVPGSSIPDGLVIFDARGEKKSETVEEGGMAGLRGDWPDCLAGYTGSSMYPPYKSTSSFELAGRCSEQLSSVAEGERRGGGIRDGDRGGLMTWVEG